MSQTQVPSILDRMLDPLSRCFNDESARKLVALQFDPELNSRVEYLAERCNEGQLTPDERKEYELIVETADIIAIIKLKARRWLATRDPE